MAWHAVATAVNCTMASQDRCPADVAAFWMLGTRLALSKQAGQR